MLIRYAARQRLRILFKIMVSSCLALAFSALFSPLQTLTHDATREGTNTISLTLQVDVGFDATFRAGYWTPVHIGISNGGVDFAGTLTVSTYSGPPEWQPDCALFPLLAERSARKCFPASHGVIVGARGCGILQCILWWIMQRAFNSKQRHNLSHRRESAASCIEWCH